MNALQEAEQQRMRAKEEELLRQHGQMVDAQAFLKEAIALDFEGRAMNFQSWSRHLNDAHQGSLYKISGLYVYTYCVVISEVVLEPNVTRV